MDYCYSEMIDMAVMVMKYSKEQLVKMLSAVDLNALQDDMVKHGATREELQHSSESFHDFAELYGDH